MPSNLNKALLFFALILAACQESGHQTSDYESFIQKGNAVVVLANNNQCWNCEKYYWVLRSLLKTNPNIRIVWITRKLKDTERVKLNEELNIEWSNSVIHIQDTDLLREINAQLKKRESKVLVLCGQKVEEFTGNKDVDSMEAHIQDCWRK